MSPDWMSTGSLANFFVKPGISKQSDIKFGLNNSGICAFAISKILSFIFTFYF